jgi:hypothetical protein
MNLRNFLKDEGLGWALSFGFVALPSDTAWSILIVGLLAVVVHDHIPWWIFCDAPYAHVQQATKTRVFSREAWLRTLPPRPSPRKEDEAVRPVPASPGPTNDGEQAKDSHLIKDS